MGLTHKLLLHRQKVSPSPLAGFRDSTFTITVQLLSINHILMSISQNEVKNTFEI